MSHEELQSKITVFGPHCQKDPAKEGRNFAKRRRFGGPAAAGFCGLGWLIDPEGRPQARPTYPVTPLASPRVNVTVPPGRAPADGA